jgi:hypothetical protein
MAKDLEKVSQQEQSFQEVNVKHYTTDELKELFGDAFSKKKVSREIEEKLFN